MKLGNHRWKDLYPQMLRGTRQFRGSDISSFARKRIAMITGGRRDEIKGEGEKKEKNATKRDIVPLLSKPAECGPNFSAALPIYILYIKIGGFTLLDMRVFRVYVYIFLQRECTPSNVSLARPEERGKTVAPYFSPFCFSPIPSFTLFPGIPLFFSLLRSLHPLFLRAFCRWWMEKVKTWPVSERMRKVCVCVCVEGASDDRWIFRKGSTELRVSSVFLSPLLPSLARERTRTLHSSLPFLCYSLVTEVLNKVFKIGWRFCKFSIISLLWLSKGVANTLESIIPRGINKNSVSDGPIKRQTTNTVPLIT